MSGWAIVGLTDEEVGETLPAVFHPPGEGGRAHGDNPLFAWEDVGMETTTGGSSTIIRPGGGRRVSRAAMAGRKNEVSPSDEIK